MPARGLVGTTTRGRRGWHPSDPQPCQHGVGRIGPPITQATRQPGMERYVANLKDVARRAGVDPSTASRVLRDDPTQQVRPETRQRIIDAARDLKYRPNALARGLRTRRTDTLGLIIPSLDNLGFADVTHGIQSAAAAAGKLVMVVEAEAAAGASNSVLRAAHRRRPAGRHDRRVRIPRRRPGGAARRARDPPGAGQPAHVARARIGGRRRRARQPDGRRAPHPPWPPAYRLHRTGCGHRHRPPPADRLRHRR